MSRKLKLLIASFAVAPFLFAIIVYLLPVCPAQGDQPKAGDAKKETSGAPIAAEKDKADKKNTTDKTQSQSRYTRIVSVLTEWSNKWLGEPIALWTYYIFGLTAGLAFYTYGLWRSTSELVSEAQDTARKDLRAYINVDDIYLPWTPNEKDPKDRTNIVWGALVKVRIKNFGRSPAKNITLRLNGAMGFAETETFDRRYGPRKYVGPKFMLNPTQDYSTRVPEKLFKLDSDNPTDEQGRTPYIFGSVVYEDIHGAWWTTHFAFHYDTRTKNRFTPTSKHNHEERNDTEADALAKLPYSD